MAKTYTITLSDAEDKALHVAAVSAQEWIDNAIHERCRIAIDEIVNAEVQRKLSANEPITGTKDDIVMAANVESAAQAKARMDAEAKARAEAEAKAQAQLQASATAPTTTAKK